MVTLAETALAVAIFSVVLSASALAWQVTVFVKSGHRVRCTMSMGYRTEIEIGAATPGHRSMTTSVKSWSRYKKFREEPGQRFNLEVSNTGRASVWVDSVGLGFGDTGDHPERHWPHFRGCTKMPSASTVCPSSSATKPTTNDLRPSVRSTHASARRGTPSRVARW